MKKNSILGYAKTNANSIKRKVELRKVVLKSILTLFVLGMLGLSFASTGSAKGGASFAGVTMSAMLIGKIAGKESSTHNADGTEKSEEEQILYKMKWNAEQLFEAKFAEFKASDPEYKELKALKEQFAAIKDINGITEKLREDLNSVGIKVNELKENPSPKAEGYKTIREAIYAAIMEKKEDFDTLANSKNKNANWVSLSIKAGTMTVANTIGSGTTQVSITTNTGIITPIRKRELTYLAAVSVGTLDGNRAMWIEETTESGTPVMIGENTAKSQLDSVWVEKTANVRKITSFTKVSTELLGDIPQLISYIETNLLKRLDIALETQYFSGDNTGNNLNGLITMATAFSAGTLAGTIPQANEFDVCEAVALQCKLAFGIPDAIFVNPATMAKMKLIKNSLGTPLWKDYDTILGGINISGLKLIETTAVSADTFVGGNLANCHVLVREELGIQIGIDGNDFTNNVKTMLAEKRVVQFASANDTPTIITGTFAVAKAALLAV